MSRLKLAERGSATRVVLVRHTEPVEEARGRCYGSSDLALSATGRAHAEALAERLAGLAPAVVVSSPRRRARETAAPIASRHGLEPEVLAGLRELDFGEVEGETYEEIERTRPDLWARWMSEPTAVRFPGGEAYADVRDRVGAAIALLRRSYAEQTSVLVAHGGVIRAVLGAALDLPDSHIFRLDQSHGAISVIDWFAETPVIRLVNG